MALLITEGEAKYQYSLIYFKRVTCCNAPQVICAEQGCESYLFVGSAHEGRRYYEDVVSN